MKKLLFSLFFIFAIFTSMKGQFIGPGPHYVTAIKHVPASIEYWAKQLAKEANKLDILKDQQNYLQQSIEFYKKIHTTVENSLLIYSILEKQYNFYQEATKALTLNMEVIGSPECYRIYSNKVKALIEKSTVNIEQTTNFITQGIFNMTDGERLEAVERLEKKTNEMFSSLYDLKRNFEGVNNRILAVKALKN